MRAESSVYSVQNEDRNPAVSEVLLRSCSEEMGQGGQYFCFAEEGTCNQAYVLAGSCCSSQGRGVSMILVLF